MKVKTLLSLIVLMLFALGVVSFLIVRAVEVDKVTQSVKLGG